MDEVWKGTDDAMKAASYMGVTIGLMMIENSEMWIGAGSIPRTIWELDGIRERLKVINFNNLRSLST